MAQRRLERRVYGHGDRLITLSRFFADVAERDYRFPRAKIRTIPGGVDYEWFATDSTREESRAALGWPTDRPVVFCLRRLARRMGLLELVDATRQLVDKQPEVLILIGGRGALEGELRDRIRDFGLEHNVRLLGFVADEDLPLAYRAADLSIVPTQVLEGFGLIALESLAAGTPVLVTPVGGLPEVVTDLSPCLVTEGAQPEQLAESLGAAIGGQLELPIAERCREYVRDNFAWPLIARRVADVYREVL